MAKSIMDYISKIFDAKNIFVIIAAIALAVVFFSYLFKGKYGPEINLGMGVFMALVLLMAIFLFVLVFLVIQRWSLNFTLTEGLVILIIGGGIIGVMIFVKSVFNLDLGIFELASQQLMSMIGRGG